MARIPKSQLKLRDINIIYLMCVYSWLKDLGTRASCEEQARIGVCIGIPYYVNS
jgi:hypothetical protein